MQFLDQVVSHSRKESTAKEYHIQNDEHGFRDDSQWLHIMIQFNDLLPLMFSPISKFFRAHSFLSCPVLFNPFCMRQIKIIYAKSLIAYGFLTYFYLCRIKNAKGRRSLNSKWHKIHIEKREKKKETNSNKEKSKKSNMAKDNRQRHKIGVIWQIHCKFKASHILFSLLIKCERPSLSYIGFLQFMHANVRSHLFAPFS